MRTIVHIYGVFRQDMKRKYTIIERKYAQKGWILG